MLKPAALLLGCQISSTECGSFRMPAEMKVRLPIPALRWLAGYRSMWLGGDLVGGITLAAYAIPVSIAYAGLAGLPPQAGLYGYLLGGLGYALLGSSRQLAIGPTSAISLMIAGTIGAMAQGDAGHYAQLASLTALAVAILCLFAWALRLSALVKLVSNSILVGFKAGAALTIAMTQLPKLFGIPGGGQNFPERAMTFAAQLGATHSLDLLIGTVAVFLLILGEYLFPRKPIALAVVALSVVAVTALGLTALGVKTTGEIPSGLPDIAWPSLHLRDVEGIFPLAAGCLLLAYIEGVSAAKALAASHGHTVDARQEFLGIGAANLATSIGHGYPVAGGLSQSAVNDKAGARTPLALVVCSIALGLCLLFLTGFLENLPQAVLAAVVLTAIAGLVDVPALVRMWQVSKPDFYAAMLALVAVLLLGILQGILLAAAGSILFILVRFARPHVAFLGRVPGTTFYSDMARHPENEPLKHAIVFRPEASILYVNADIILDTVLDRLSGVNASDIRLAVCDLSSSPNLDLAGSHMLHELHRELEQRGIPLRIVGAHGRVRDLLRADGIGAEVGGIDRRMTVAELVESVER